MSSTPVERRFYGVLTLDDEKLADLFDLPKPYFPPRSCAPGTMTEALNTLREWARAQDTATIMFLTGPAGSGKSTLLRSFSQQLASKDASAGSVFLSSMHSDRSQVDKFPELAARQLALQFPDIVYYAFKALAHDPSLVGKGLRQRLDRLVFEPLQMATRAITVFIVDGLDECHNTEDAVILVNCFIDLFKCRIGSGFKVLIAARDFATVGRALAIGHVSGVPFDALRLGHSTHISDSIYTFLTSGFSALGQQGVLETSEEMIEVLAGRADRSFTYASLVVSLMHRHKALNVPPQTLLAQIMEQTHQREGFSALEGLYTLAIDLVTKSLPSHLRYRSLLLLWHLATDYVLVSRSPSNLTLTPPGQLHELERFWGLEILPLMQGGLDLFVTMEQQRLRFIDRTFFDFLVKPTCPHRYALHPGHTTTIAVQALRHLRINGDAFPTVFPLVTLQYCRLSSPSSFFLGLELGRGHLARALLSSASRSRDALVEASEVYEPFPRALRQSVRRHLVYHALLLTCLTRSVICLGSDSDTTPTCCHWFVRNWFVRGTKLRVDHRYTT